MGAVCCTAVLVLPNQWLAIFFKATQRSRYATFGSTFNAIRSAYTLTLISAIALALKVYLKRLILNLISTLNFYPFRGNFLFSCCVRERLTCTLVEQNRNKFECISAFKRGSKRIPTFFKISS